MKLLDLFSGIGGFSLGLERAGMRTVAFCEIDPYCQRVLKKHWPHVPCYGDIRTLTAARLAADGIIRPLAWDAGRRGNGEGCGENGRVQKGPNTVAAGICEDGASGIDAICGGFPCQDISVAGKGAGITGERSGLWSEYRRLVGELRPRIVIVENVTALLGRGLSTVLGDLAALGFDCEWHCIPASAVGAPHRRDRVWIVAHPARARWDQRSDDANGFSLATCCDEQGQPNRTGTALADAHDQGQLQQGGIVGEVGRRAGNGGQAMADAGGGRSSRPWQPVDAVYPAPCSIGQAIKLVDGGVGDIWRAEPSMGELVDGVSDRLVRFRGRVATGVPNRVNKLRALGNAVIPQIPELIGRAINGIE